MLRGNNLPVGLCRFQGGPGIAGLPYILQPTLVPHSTCSSCRKTSKSMRPRSMLEFLPSKTASSTGTYQSIDFPLRKNNSVYLPWLFPRGRKQIEFALWRRQFSGRCNIEARGCPSAVNSAAYFHRKRRDRCFLSRAPCGRKGRKPKHMPFECLRLLRAPHLSTHLVLKLQMCRAKEAHAQIAAKLDSLINRESQETRFLPKPPKHELDN